MAENRSEWRRRRRRTTLARLIVLALSWAAVALFVLGAIGAVRVIGG